MILRLFCLALALSTVCPAASESPFYLPIRNNDLAAIRKLIRDPGPKVRDARGNSPLMYAAALGSLETLRLLVEAGGDVEFREISACPFERGCWALCP